MFQFTLASCSNASAILADVKIANGLVSSFRHTICCPVILLQNLYRSWYDGNTWKGLQATLWVLCCTYKVAHVRITSKYVQDHLNIDLWFVWCYTFSLLHPETHWHPPSQDYIEPFILIQLLAHYRIMAFLQHLWQMASQSGHS